MRRRRILQLLAAAPLARAARVAGAEHPAPRALGYLPWWMADGWREMPWRALERLVLFDAPVGEDGALLEREWLRRAADFRGIAVDLGLSLMKEERFERVFGDRAARTRLLADCVRILSEPSIGGLHLDFEGYRAVGAGVVAAFREWLAALDGRRREMRKGLSAFFPASDSFAIYGAGAADRIDYWVAQLYDAHWKESKLTGPLVTREETNAVAVQRALARLAALRVPPGRVLLSVPLYGWQWPSDSERPGAAARGAASLLTYAETPEALMPNDRLAATGLARVHGLRRDREHSPYFAYRDGAHWLQGWYEDVASLTRKLAPERTRGYAGLAFFPLGYDKGEVVEAMLRWWRGADPKS